MEDLHSSLYSRRSSSLPLILRSMERWAQSSRTVAEHVTNLRIKQHWQQYVKKCLKNKAAYEAAKTAGEKVGSKYDPLPFGPSFSPTSQNIEPTKHKSALYTILAFCHDKRCKGFNCIITDGMMSIYPILNIDLLHNVGCDLIEIYLVYIENDLKDKGLLKKSTPKDNESKEVPWSDDDTNYMLNSEAIVKFTNSKMSLSKLTKDLKNPNNEIHHMQKGQRCKVHIGDFIKYAKQHYLPDAAAAEIANEYIADIEARKLQEDPKKTKKP